MGAGERGRLASATPTTRAVPPTPSPMPGAARGLFSSTGAGPLTQQTWTTDEVSALRQQVAAGRSAPEIKLRGRSRMSVYNKAKKLGTKAAVKVAPPWTAGEVKTLRLMVAFGASATKISAALPGRSRGAVMGKCRRLRLQLLAARWPLPRRTYHVVNPAGRYDAVKLVPPLVARAARRQDTPRPAGHDRVRLYDHKPGQCRYVVVAAPETQDGVALLCSAARVPGRSWCERHGQGIYELPKPKVR
jgi:hypothetical protein